jgi:hypothetical protein
VTGAWFHAGYIDKTKRVELRRLSIDAQNGANVSGSYRVTGNADRSFTGTLIAPRNIRITADGVSLEGVLPGRLYDDGENLTLQSRGDSADGQRLDFRAVVGDPSTPAPDADMRVSFGDDPEAWGPIASVTPVHIDGTASRGVGLTSFIEFGEGFVATTSQATHVVDAPPYPPLTARLTVVDRFGRSDTESLDYFVYDLGAQGSPSGDYWTTSNGPDLIRIFFDSRSGRTYGGRIQRVVGSESEVVSVSASVTGLRDVIITVAAWGIEYRGTIVMAPGYNVQMNLVQSGGAGAGRALTLYRRSYY